MAYTKRIYNDRLSNLSGAQKFQVGFAIIENIRDLTADGISPVDGQSFTPLKQEYADKVHGGDRTARLRESGQMMQLLDVVSVGDDYIEIGYVGQDIGGVAEGNETGRRGNGIPGGVTGPINPRPFLDSEFDFIESAIDDVEFV